MSLIEIRKRSLTIETIYHEGGPVADRAPRLDPLGDRLCRRGACDQHAEQSQHGPCQALKNKRLDTHGGILGVLADLFLM